MSRRTGFICDPLHPVVRAGRRCTLVGTAAVAWLATHALADPIADATLAPATCVRLPSEAVVSAALPLWILTLSRLDASALTRITDAVGAGAPSRQAEPCGQRSSSQLPWALQRSRRPVRSQRIASGVHTVDGSTQLPEKQTSWSGQAS